MDLRPRLDMTTLRRVLAERLGAGTAATAHAARDDVTAATGVAFDDRRVRPGDAFFALRGAHGHGIDHADGALARGAAFVVSDRPHPRGVVVDDPAALLLALGHEARTAWTGPVVGVSGSVGKTTAKALLTAALLARSSAGNRNTPLALACTLVDGWLDGATASPLVLELGIDHVGEMDRLVELVRPTHALLTTIDVAHLDGLGDLAGVTREKSKLLHAAAGGRYAGELAWSRLEPGLRSVTTRYALDADEPPTGRTLATPDGPALEARLANGEPPLHLRLPGLGRALAEHALGALLVARDLGVDAAHAAARIAEATLEGRRLELRAVGDLTVLDDSYNASPSSMRHALEVLRDMPRPHGAVIGDMRELGSESERHHRALADTTRDLPTLWAIGPQSEALARANPHARHYPDVASALDDVDALPRHGTLLVKGSRSIELERLVDALAVARAERDALAETGR